MFRSLALYLKAEKLTAEKLKSEWSNRVSDIEGKAARVAASECGQRASFKR